MVPRIAEQGGQARPGPDLRSVPAVMLSARNVVKRFGGVAAVDDLSLDIGRGRIAGLIGPNGAGKTTMFDLLAGHLKPSGGEIRLDGAPVGTLPAHRRAGLGLGRSFQIPRPFPTMTVVENVMLGAQGQRGERILPNWLRPAAVARQERDSHERAMDLLRFVSLDRLAREPARVLSGGQRKLLELARLLMAEPKMLLLDEPAAGVNPSLLEIIMDRITAINARGMTIFLIEHNMDLVARLCSHVFVMAQGRLLCQGTPGEVARDPAVIDAYLGTGAG